MTELRNMDHYDDLERGNAPTVVTEPTVSDTETRAKCLLTLAPLPINRIPFVAPDARPPAAYARRRASSLEAL